MFAEPSEGGWWQFVVSADRIVFAKMTSRVYELSIPAPQVSDTWSETARGVEARLSNLRRLRSDLEGLQRQRLRVSFQESKERERVQAVHEAEKTLMAAILETRTHLQTLGPLTRCQDGIERARREAQVRAWGATLAENSQGARENLSTYKDKVASLQVDEEQGYERQGYERQGYERQEQVLELQPLTESHTQELAQLATQLEQIADMMQDLQILIQNNGLLLDKIEAHTEDTLDRTEGGVKELEGGLKLVKDSVRCKIYASIGCVVVMGFVALLAWLVFGRG